MGWFNHQLVFVNLKEKIVSLLATNISLAITSQGPKAFLEDYFFIFFAVHQVGYVNFLEGRRVA